MFALLLQSFAVALVGHFGRMIERALHAAVLPDQLRCAFFPDALGAGDIVDGVPEQCHVIHHFFRRHSQKLFDLLFIHDDVALSTARAGPQGSHTFANELHHVFVVGHNQDFQIVLSRFDRHRSDHIVRFVTLDFEHRQAHRCAQATNKGQLHAHFLRHGLPLRFVLFEKLVAESRTRRIKHNSNVVRLVVLQEPSQDISE